LRKSSSARGGTNRPTATFSAAARWLDIEPDRLVTAPETLSDGELTLQLIPAQSGETDDALFVQDPKHGLLLVGDAFMPYLGAPFVAEGSPEGYLRAIDQVLQLRPSRLIHGHQPLSAFFTIEAMPGLKGALSELYESTLSSAQRGRPLAEVLNDNLLPAVLRSSPAAVQPYLVARDGFIERSRSTWRRSARSLHRRAWARSLR
jgi:glyoxylase-like metal-dependent hydrolase (beta-lactamase superfamily II)